MSVIYAALLLVPIVVVAVILILRSKMRESREARKLEAVWQKVHMLNERDAVIKKEKLEKYK